MPELFRDGNVENKDSSQPSAFSPQVEPMLAEDVARWHRQRMKRGCPTFRAFRNVGFHDRRKRRIFPTPSNSNVLQQALQHAALGPLLCTVQNTGDLYNVLANAVHGKEGYSRKDKLAGSRF